VTAAAKEAITSGSLTDPVVTQTQVRQSATAFTAVALGSSGRCWVAKALPGGEMSVGSVNSSVCTPDEVGPWAAVTSETKRWPSEPPRSTAVRELRMMTAGETFDPSIQESISIATAAGFPYDGIVLGPNGKLYLIPREESRVAVVDPILESVSFVGSLSSPSAIKYGGGALAPNGKIYACPFLADNVLVIDTSNDSVTEISRSAIPGTWIGAVRAPDGRIVCIPNGWTTNVLVIDPVTGVLSTIPKPAGSWATGAVGADGAIYAMPSFSTWGVLRVNLATASSSVIPLPWGRDFLGTVTAPNGALYGVPRTSDRVLRVDPASGRAIEVGASLLNTGGVKHRGGVVVPGGFLFLPASGAPTAVLVDPATDAVTTIVSSIGSSAGAALAPDGRVWIPTIGPAVAAVGTPRSTPLPIDPLLRATSSSF
jgi:DNA-binding beta-propeller fold protein YncE